MATWGSQTWGFSNWGTLGDQAVELSGVQSNSTLGSADAQSVPGWGTQYWGAGEWGDLKSPEAAVTGQELTSTTQTVTAFTDVTVELTGQELGPIIIGDYQEGISVEASPTGIESNSIVNSVFGGELVTVEVTSPSNDPWGNTLVGWGNGLWGVGDGITLVGETVAGTQADANVEITGQELQSTVESVVAGISIAVSPSGESIGTISIGDFFAGELVEVQVTTASTQPWGELTWGDGQWGQSVGTDISQGGEEVATPSVEVDVTGEELTSNTGNESITGDANLTLTGISLDLQQGDEDAFTNVRINVTGNDVGTVIIGDYLAGVSADVDVSGVTASVSTGIIGLNAWELVDSGTSPTWTVVDKAA